MRSKEQGDDRLVNVVTLPYPTCCQHHPHLLSSPAATTPCYQHPHYHLSSPAACPASLSPKRAASGPRGPAAWGSRAWLARRRQKRRRPTTTRGEGSGSWRWLRGMGDCNNVNTETSKEGEFGFWRWLGGGVGGGIRGGGKGGQRGTRSSVCSLSLINTQLLTIYPSIHPHTIITKATPLTHSQAPR